MYTFKNSIYPEEALLQNESQDHRHSSEDTNLDEELCIQSSWQCSIIHNISSFFNGLTNSWQCLEHTSASILTILFAENKRKHVHTNICKLVVVLLLGVKVETKKINKTIKISKNGSSINFNQR